MRTYQDDIQLPMEHGFSRALLIVAALVGTAVVIGLGLGVGQAYKPTIAALAPTPGADKPLAPRALSIRSELPRGVYGSTQAGVLLAEPAGGAETAESDEPDVTGNGNPSAIDPTTSVLRKDRYQQYLSDQGLVPIEKVKLREQTARDENGKVVETSREILVPETAKTR